MKNFMTIPGSFEFDGETVTIGLMGKAMFSDIHYIRGNLSALTAKYGNVANPDEIWEKEIETILKGEEAIMSIVDI